MLSALVELAAQSSVPVVVGLAALVLAVESGTPYGMVVPGTTVAAGLGVWSALGGHSTAVAMAAAAAGTVAGTQVGWWRGRRGVVLPAPVARSARVAAAVDRSRRWIGGQPASTAAVLVGAGHWAAALRPLLPRVAAAGGMRYRRAGPALVVSGSAWAGTLVGLGAWIGPHAAATVPWAGPLLVVGVVATLAVRSARRRRRDAAPGRHPVDDDGRDPTASSRIPAASSNDVPSGC